MQKIKNPTFVLLLIILSLAVFLRSFLAVERFDFAHDGDLYSWIVKDIVVDKHIRLIGQLTSTPGIYIGPLFYYSLIPFFLLTNMDPLGVLFIPPLLGILTTLSFYFVFKKLFSTEAGLIAAFLNAVLLTRVYYERWVVPTMTSSLWEIWFFYVIFSIAKKNFDVMPILGILTGLVWHINFSLAPIFITVPLAFLIARKLPNLKQVSLAILAFVITSLPLLLFEVRHNFSQTKALVDSFLIPQGGTRGLEKFIQVITQVTGNTYQLFLYPSRGNFVLALSFSVALIVLSLLMIRKNGFTKFNLGLLFVWVFTLIGFFAISSKPVSEYYFHNLETVFLGIVAVGLSLIYKKIKYGKNIVIIFLAVVLIRSVYLFINFNPYNFSGYQQRKAVANYIKEDSLKKGYKCVAVNYIVSQGNNLGYRYMFYLSGLRVNKVKENIPVYDIVMPLSFVTDKKPVRFGSIGVLAPEQSFEANKVNEACGDRNDNISDSMFGFTN